MTQIGNQSYPYTHSSDDVVPVTPPTYSTTTPTTVAGSASSVTLLAANASRKQAYINNDSTAILYITEGATASTTNYTFKLLQDDVYVSGDYKGVISGIWASATGNARVTEA